MKKITQILTLCLLPFAALCQTQTIEYSAGTGVNGFQTASVTFNYLSTCQTAVTLDGNAGIYNGVSWSSGTFSVIVNGVNIGSFASPTNGIDLTAYIPITSIELTSSASTWHTVGGTVHLTSSTASAPTPPTASNVYYNVGQAASPLTATLTGAGTTLKWYTQSNGSGYSTTAPTPNTASEGIFSYYVSQADAGGCESERAEIKVYVGTDSIQYNAGTGVNGFQTASVTMNYLSTCQEEVYLDGSAGIYNGVSWSSGTFTAIVNGVNIGTYASPTTLDLTPYIPVTSVQLNSSASTWHTVGGTVTVISYESGMPTAPTVANVTYCQNDPASPLSAGLSGSGTTLKWYTNSTGGGYSSTAPTPNTATPGTTNYWVAQADAGGCEGPRAEIAVTVNAPSSGTDVQAACDSYTWIDGNTYTASNSTAQYTLTNAAGCDSVVTLNLTVTNSNTGTDVQTACDSYTWIDGNTYTASNSTAQFTLTNAAGCDSVVTLNLTVTNSNAGTDVQTACDSYTWIDGNTYTASNSTAQFTLTNAAGCDSVVTLNLTVTNSNAGTDVQTACDSYTWIDGNTYTTSNNTATFVLNNAAGCDSIVTLNLTINTVDVTLTATDPSIMANNAGAVYQWLDCDNGMSAISGATAQTFTATANGNYAVEITDNGCTDTSACQAIVSVGLEEIDLGSVNIWPNPSQGLVEISSTQVIQFIRVIDALGAVLYEQEVAQETVKLDLQHMADGMYMIEIVTTNGRNLKPVLLHK